MSTSLRAVYTSPQDPPSRSFELQIVSPPPVSSEASPENAKAKVAYLSELRKLASTMQNDINVFLTAQMEEDKKAAEAQGRKISEKEAQEEANYGEEVVEEDA